MSVKLVLLGMLKRKPQYGYELKSAIEQEMGDWTSIAFGSIYFALKKLTEEKLIIQSSIEHSGGRPSRIIYKITPAGVDEFRNLLLKTWMDRKRQFFPLDIGLYFINELEQGEALNLVQGKIQECNFALEYLAKHRDEEMSDPHIPPSAEMIFSHSFYHLEAELSWLQNVAKRIEAGGI